MATLARAFRTPVGLSDHTFDPDGYDVCCLGAVATGGCLIEKHITFDRTRPGPDHSFALEPGEFRALVRRVRLLEEALGDGSKRPVPRELERLSLSPNQAKCERYCLIPSPNTYHH